MNFAESMLKNQLLRTTRLLMELSAKGNFSIESHQRLSVGIQWKYQQYFYTSNFYRLFLIMSLNASQWHIAKV